MLQKLHVCIPGLMNKKFKDQLETLFVNNENDCNNDNFSIDDECVESSNIDVNEDSRDSSIGYILSGDDDSSNNSIDVRLSRKRKNPFIFDEAIEDCNDNDDIVINEKIRKNDLDIIDDTDVSDDYNEEYLYHLQSMNENI